jgi:hypothetical protein
MKDQFMMVSVPDEGSVHDGEYLMKDQFMMVSVPDEGSVHGGECTR